MAIPSHIANSEPPDKDPDRAHSDVSAGTKNAVSTKRVTINTRQADITFRLTDNNQLDCLFIGVKVKVDGSASHGFILRNIPQTVAPLLSFNSLSSLPSEDLVKKIYQIVSNCNSSLPIYSKLKFEISHLSSDTKNAPQGLEKFFNELLSNQLITTRLVSSYEEWAISGILTFSHAISVTNNDRNRTFSVQVKTPADFSPGFRYCLCVDDKPLDRFNDDLFDKNATSSDLNKMHRKLFDLLSIMADKDLYYTIEHIGSNLVKLVKENKSNRPNCISSSLDNNFLNSANPERSAISGHDLSDVNGPSGNFRPKPSNHHKQIVNKPRPIDVNDFQDPENLRQNRFYLLDGQVEVLKTKQPVPALIIRNYLQAEKFEAFIFRDIDPSHQIAVQAASNSIDWAFKQISSYNISTIERALVKLVNDNFKFEIPCSLINKEWPGILSDLILSDYERQSDFTIVPKPKEDLILEMLTGCSRFRTIRSISSKHSLSTMCLTFFPEGEAAVGFSRESRFPLNKILIQFKFSDLESSNNSEKGDITVKEFFQLYRMSPSYLATTLLSRIECSVKNVYLYTESGNVRDYLVEMPHILKKAGHAIATLEEIRSIDKFSKTNLYSYSESNLNIQDLDGATLTQYYFTIKDNLENELSFTITSSGIANICCSCPRKLLGLTLFRQEIVDTCPDLSRIRNPLESRHLIEALLDSLEINQGKWNKKEIESILKLY